MTSRNGISVGRRGALRASLRTRSTAAVSSQIYAVQKFKMIHTLYRSGTLAFRARITAPSRSSKPHFWTGPSWLVAPLDAQTGGVQDLQGAVLELEAAGRQVLG